MDESPTEPVRPEPDETPARPSPAAHESGGGSRARHVLLSALLTVLVVGLGLAGFKLLEALKEKPARGARPALRTAVRVEPAARSAYRETLAGYGRARALREAQVSAELAGRVTWVSPRLESGSTVPAGAELVRIDDQDARAAVAAAEARSEQALTAVERARDDLTSLGGQVAAARRELETSRRELERIRGMVPDAASPSELDKQQIQTTVREQALLVLEGRERNASATVRWNEAEAAAAAAALDRARIDLSHASVAAPYAGTIAARHAHEGARVVPGTALFDIVDLSAVEIPVSLPASQFGSVRVGAPANVRMREGGDVVWSGPVARISPVVDTTNRTFTAFLEIRGAAGSAGSAAVVPPGSFVVAEVEGRLSESVIVVPRIAFVGDVLYVAQPTDDVQDGAPDEALVTERTPAVRRWLAEVVLVESGLEPGERVIVTNVEQIAAGARVRVLPGSEAAQR